MMSVDEINSIRQINKTAMKKFFWTFFFSDNNSCFSE